jgi:hypothetical protein
MKANSRKKLFAIIMAVVLCFAFIPGGVAAQSHIHEGCCTAEFADIGVQPFTVRICPNLCPTWMNVVFAHPFPTGRTATRQCQACPPATCTNSQFGFEYEFTPQLQCFTCGLEEGYNGGSVTPLRFISWNDRCG